MEKNNWEATLWSLIFHYIRDLGCTPSGSWSWFEPRSSNSGQRRGHCFKCWHDNLLRRERHVYPSYIFFKILQIYLFNKTFSLQVPGTNYPSMFWVSPAIWFETVDDPSHSAIKMDVNHVNLSHLFSYDVTIKMSISFCVLCSITAFPCEYLNSNEVHQLNNRMLQCSFHSIWMFFCEGMPFYSIRMFVFQGIHSANCYYCILFSLWQNSTSFNGIAWSLYYSLKKEILHSNNCGSPF